MASDARCAWRAFRRDRPGRRAARRGPRAVSGRSGRSQRGDQCLRLLRAGPVGFAGRMSTGAVDVVRAAQRRAAPWPYARLDVAATRAAGHSPVPFREFVLKVHQRCNLACDYCYVYRHADQTWMDRPRSMSMEIWRAALGRIAEHVRAHRLDRARLILHGGEPLLYGIGGLSEMATTARAALDGVCRVQLGLQTNGVLVDEHTVQMFVEHGIRTGISIDGTAANHDRHRRMPSGRGSFRAAERALNVLRRPEYRDAYGGILCTDDPDVDPIACYEQLCIYEPPA